jgi:hypothetical protein
MTTLAGPVLDVEIDDTPVATNGNLTIVDGDIFCEQGIMPCSLTTLYKYTIPVLKMYLVDNPSRKYV